MSPKYITFTTPVEITAPGGSVTLEAAVTARRDCPGWSWWIESAIVAAAGADIAPVLSGEIHDALAMMAAQISASQAA